MAERIIPGVQVSVIKEVVPPQLAPSGVFGLVGITETVPGTTERASSWNTFIEIFGPASAYSMPEARQAIQNGVFELVVCPTVEGSGKKALVDVKDADDKVAFTLQARAAGIWSNGLEIKVKTRKAGGNKNVFDLSIQIPGTSEYEVIRNLSLKDSAAAEALQNSSSIVKIKDGSIKETAVLADGTYVLATGQDATTKAYSDSLQLLVNEPDVDMVAVSVQDIRTLNKTAAEKTAASTKAVNLYSEIISHCDIMSSDSKGRIGFGQIPAWATPDDAEKMVESLISDRFVLFAPSGVVGAAAGMIGGLSYFHSPTFKNISGLGDFDAGFGLEDQRQLLKANVVPIVKERGRGVILLRGLTTDGDQINVRRVADRAVRGVKMIGELYIGRLNTEDGRNSLKQKLVEFLMQMAKDNAIVPSTDGSDPAFKIDVYSSQADFAKGIVRVDMAVRPVRAIDFIYATVLVQV